MSDEEVREFMAVSELGTRLTFNRSLDRGL